jgi:putative PIN family toxin of toxin-antitoxin system
MEAKNRYVFDTGVLVSAVLFPDSVPGRAMQKALRRGRLLLSQATAEELAEVLNRRKFDRYVSVPTRKRFLAALVREALVVETSQTFVVCRDPKDDKFLELAVCGNASFLVTGDQDLLVLHPFHGISILTPAQFLAALTAS